MKSAKIGRGGRSRIVIGLNSGTSADGVDAAACEIAGRGVEMRVKLLAHVGVNYPAELRERVLDVMAPAATRTEEICRLGRDIGVAFADAAAELVRRLGLKRVDLVGSHGQTVCHLPVRGKEPSGEGTRSSRKRGQGNGIGATMQIGEAAIIAERLRVPVVSQFRQADVAAGGQGAPLVPWTDYVLFRHPKKNRIIQNIGGIANLTWLPAGGSVDDVIAFDTGPGNMIIDALVRHFTKGRKQFDRDGRMASRGRVDGPLEKAMWRRVSRWLVQPPPRSLGREEFGEAFVAGLLRRFGELRHARGRKSRRRNVERGLREEDWIATATDVSAATMYLSYGMYLPWQKERPAVDELIVCGGGAKNGAMMRMLRSYLDLLYGSGAIAIRGMEEFGISSQAKECVSFAMLAAACADGVAGNLRQVTGAGRRVVLGQVAHVE